MNSRILATGSYLPTKVRTNADLEKMVDTSDEWIVTRSGIRERRIAEPDETVATMGAKAAQQALEMAGIEANDIDLIVVEQLPTPTLTQVQLAKFKVCFRLKMRLLLMWRRLVPALCML